MVQFIRPEIVLMELCSRDLSRLAGCMHTSLLIFFHNLERYGRRSFSRAGPTLWNALPEELRSTVCMNKFKTHLKTYYFKIAFNV